MPRSLKISSTTSAAAGVAGVAGAECADSIEGDGARMRTMGVVGVDTFDLSVGCMAAVSSAAPFLRKTSNSFISGEPLAWPMATINMAAMSTNAAAFLWYLLPWGGGLNVMRRLPLLTSTRAFRSRSDGLGSTTAPCNFRDANFLRGAASWSNKAKEP